MKIHIITLQKKICLKFMHLIPVFFFLSISTSAQSLDSLEQVLMTKKLTDKEKIEIYKDLSWGYHDKDIERSVSYGEKGLELAEKIENKNRIATFHLILGTAHYMASAYNEAKFHLDEALPVAEKVDDYVLESSIYNCYANIYHAEGNYEMALEKYLGALEILDKHNDIHKLTILYTNIGGIYQMMKNYDHALKYFNKAKELTDQTKDQNSLAIIYVSLSDIARNQKQPIEIAIDYAQKAVD